MGPTRSLEIYHLIIAFLFSLKLLQALDEVITILRRNLAQMTIFRRQGSRRIYGGRRKSSTLTFTLPDMSYGKGALKRQSPYYGEASMTSTNGVKMPSEAFQLTPLTEEAENTKPFDDGYV